MFGLNLGTIITFGLGVILGMYLGNKEFRVKVNNMLDGLLKKKAKPDANVHQNTTETKRERDD